MMVDEKVGLLADEMVAVTAAMTVDMKVALKAAEWGIHSVAKMVVE